MKSCACFQGLPNSFENGTFPISWVLFERERCVCVRSFIFYLVCSFMLVHEYVLSQEDTLSGFVLKHHP